MQNKMETKKQKTREKKKLRRRLQQKVIEFALKSYAACPRSVGASSHRSSLPLRLATGYTRFFNHFGTIININYFRGLYG